MNEVTNEVTADFRRSILDLEDEIRKLPQIEPKLEHFFARGVYARALHIPKGYVLTGKIHKYSQINVLLKGKMAIASVEGTKDMNAGDIIESGPGVKRAGYAYEDSVWLTIHGTHERDLERLEEELISPSFESYDQFLLENKPCPGQPLLEQPEQ
jgi:hypothetical protein